MCSRASPLYCRTLTILDARAAARVTQRAVRLLITYKICRASLRHVNWPCHGHIEEVLLQDFEVENLSYGVQKYYYDFVDKNDGGVAVSILEYQFGIHSGVTTEPKCQPRIVRTH